jgi:hypothetical protein
MIHFVFFQDVLPSLNKKTPISRAPNPHIFFQIQACVAMKPHLCLNVVRHPLHRRLWIRVDSVDDGAAVGVKGVADTLLGAVVPEEEEERQLERAGRKWWLGLVMILNI